MKIIHQSLIFGLIFFLFLGDILPQKLNNIYDSSFVEKINNIEFKMIKIPYKNYYAAQSEVTQELWQAITGENPSQYQKCPKCPVESVSYNDIVQKFLPKLNQLTQKEYRLPSYREWFFAALGGEKFKEGRKSNINDIAWTYENSKLTPQIVMQKQPNGYGLYDMLGNVQEWTNEAREGYQKRLVYLIMGGDWSWQGFHFVENDYDLFPPDKDDEGTGFRLFLSVQ